MHPNPFRWRYDTGAFDESVPAAAIYPIQVLTPQFFSK